MKAPQPPTLDSRLHSPWMFGTTRLPIFEVLETKTELHELNSVPFMGGYCRSLTPRPQETSPVKAQNAAGKAEQPLLSTQY